ncbi:hypothetical protein FIU85_05510 [Roseovarius sp. THAF8]|nr:hypothetical protein FIU85_05510 [Roseovarius sp. THAF8]
MKLQLPKATNLCPKRNAVKYLKSATEPDFAHVRDHSHIFAN